MQDRQEIAFAFPRGTHQEMCIQGILDYAREERLNWSYVTAPESLSLSLLDLSEWEGDGIIAAINTEEEANLAVRLPLPIVNISSFMINSPVPRVNVDNRRIGELAGEHLLARNFRSFAYYGLQDAAYSQLRHEGFASILEGGGYEADSLLVTPTFGLQGSEWQQQHRLLADWLTQLQFPVALFAVTDYRARQALDVCHRLGLEVPQQIAVLGVDNEDFICRHMKPPLSSVSRNDRLEGFRAAAALNSLMRGESIPSLELIVPKGVLDRQSTDTIAVFDDRIRAALDYVNKHLDDTLDVNRIARHIGVSRRWLEYAFRDSVGESPYQYIRNRRLEQVVQLLAENRKMKIAEIAYKTGFTSAKQLSMSFQQWSGMSPSEYRRSLQSESQ